VKRTVILSVAGVALLGVVLYVGRLWEQTAHAAPSGPPTSRIALLNLSHVIKSYAKYAVFQEELKQAVDPFQKRDQALKLQAEEYAKSMTKPETSQPQREEIEKKLKELQRQVEDNKAEANKALVKKQEEQLKILYMDVRQVAERHAVAQGYEMVLHYNDHVKAEEYWSPQNIARKMNAGALMPLYYVGGIDISQAVIDTLNTVYKSNPQQHPATGAAPAGAAPAGAAPGR
jgi:Skp family chaperone for outer membrane proteins